MARRGLQILLAVCGMLCGCAGAGPDRPEAAGAAEITMESPPDPFHRITLRVESMDGERRGSVVNEAMLAWIRQDVHRAIYGNRYVRDAEVAGELLGVVQGVVLRLHYAEGTPDALKFKIHGEVMEKLRKRGYAEFVADQVVRNAPGASKPHPSPAYRTGTIGLGVREKSREMWEGRVVVYNSGTAETSGAAMEIFKNDPLDGEMYLGRQEIHLYPGERKNVPFFLDPEEVEEGSVITVVLKEFGSRSFGDRQIQLKLGMR